MKQQMSLLEVTLTGERENKSSEQRVRSQGTKRVKGGPQKGDPKKGHVKVGPQQCLS